MRTQILIVGDSHTQAIKHALKHAAQGREKNIQCRALRYSKLKNGKDIGDLEAEQINDLVSRLQPNDLVVSCIGGNQHQTLALVQHPVPFDVLLPDVAYSEVPPGVSIIPYQQIRDIFERGLRGKDGERLQQLKAAAAGKVLHLLPPPPKEDVAHILAKHETAFAQAGIQEKGVSPAALRLKFWRIQADVLGDLTQQWGITLLPPPPDALTSEGYLAPPFYADDATHGNAAYGALVVEQISNLSAQFIDGL